MRLASRLVSFLFLVVIGAVLVAGCTADETNPTQSPARQATSTEDIVGIWESRSGAHRFDEDGTHGWALSVEVLRRRTKVAGGEFWFEDGQHYHTAILCAPSKGPGVYEIQLLEEGRAVFKVVEDRCQKRERWLVGASSQPVVWTKVE